VAETFGEILLVVEYLLVGREGKGGKLLISNFRMMPLKGEDRIKYRSAS
jgi:hypothetical protein